MHRMLQVDIIGTASALYNNIKGITAFFARLQNQTLIGKWEGSVTSGCLCYMHTILWYDVYEQQGI